MPELPDVTVYIEALEARLRGARLLGIRLASPFVLRSVDPPPAEACGRAVVGLRRLGKRIVIALEADLFVLIHLMIAGRLHWKEAGARLPGKVGLAALDFSTGTLTLTEAGSKRRAALHQARGRPRWPSTIRAGSSSSRPIWSRSGPRSPASRTPSSAP
jgi:formamidopyrimidine-DNA glycosylase